MLSPRYGELVLILILGAAQPFVEMNAGSQAATYYNLLAVVLVCLYLGFRIQRSGGAILREWGMRTDTFKDSILPYSIFVATAAIGLYAYGYVVGNTPLPIGFWYLLALYPPWGFAQQFVLQNFLVRNLFAFFPSIYVRALIASVFFSLAHAPSVELMILTFGGGIFFTLLYHRYPNMYALGTAHGIVGALAFHLVLGQNQWEILVRYFY